MAREKSTPKAPKRSLKQEREFIEMLIDVAQSKKVMRIRHGECEITMHPAAWNKTRERNPDSVPDEQNLTPEQIEEKKQKQHEAELFWSAGGPEFPI